MSDQQPDNEALDAQQEYDTNPDLQALLADAANSPTVKRNPRKDNHQ